MHLQLLHTWRQSLIRTDIAFKWEPSHRVFLWTIWLSYVLVKHWPTLSPAKLLLCLFCYSVLYIYDKSIDRWDLPSLAPVFLLTLRHIVLERMHWCICDMTSLRLRFSRFRPFTSRISSPTSRSDRSAGEPANKTEGRLSVFECRYINTSFISTLIFEFDLISL